MAATMAYHWQGPAEQDITAALSNPSYTDFSTLESYIQSIPNDQFAQLLEPAFLSGTEWTEPACTHPSPGQFDLLAQDDTLIQPAEQVETEAQVAEEKQNTEDTATELRNALSELERKYNNLEETMERRLAEIEEKVGSLQTGLEEEKTRFCNEINSHIERLRGWASEVKCIFSKVTEYRM